MRLFLAWPLSGPAAEAAGRAIAGLRAAAPGARWYDPATLHVTAAFLGEVPASRVPELRALAAAAEGASPSPQRAALEGLGAFPSWDAPRIVWAGVGEGAAALCALEAGLRARLAAAGFPIEDRPFTPHVTLGRLKDKRQAATLRAAAGPWTGPEAWRAAAFPCGPVRLYSSVLAASGAVHAEALG
ncbi:RNA 2',3'-cyclic phosphodiesterase [bacterium]|nr:MAG: RNA 2',3'-cyclic phosphodiesterase [bacterium]